MSFHTYVVNEIYSNADGTIQFIELRENANANSQSFLTGHTLTVAQAGSTTHTFTFLVDLPSTQTAGTSVLLATQGFANLGLVTPNYIIPSGFLFTSGGGSVNFGGVDVMTYTTLPLDGSGSLARNGSVNTNSPTNFAGVTGTVPPPANHAPTVGTAIADQAAVVAQAFSLHLTPTQFVDADVGDTLSLTATRADGSPLPTWLNFNPATLTFTGTPGSNDIGPLGLRVTATDKFGASVADNFVLQVDPPAPAITGTLVADTLIGTAAGELINGLDGNDKLIGAGGNDTLNGGLGIDTAGFSGTRAQSTFTVAGNGTVSQVSGPDGIDALLGMERLQFSDISLAYDLGGAAGSTARLLGAVFGPAGVQNETYCGIGIGLFDGGTTYAAAAELAIQAVLGAAISNDALVKLLYTNLVGVAPDAATVAAYSALISSGQFTHVSLTTFAADHELNLANIGLTGLAQTGLEFLPVVG